MECFLLVGPICIPVETKEGVVYYVAPTEPLIVLDLGNSSATHLVSSATQWTPYLSTAVTGRVWGLTTIGWSDVHHF